MILLLLTHYKRTLQNPDQKNTQKIKIKWVYLKKQEQ